MDDINNEPQAWEARGGLIMITLNQTTMVKMVKMIYDEAKILWHALIPHTWQGNFRPPFENTTDTHSCATAYNHCWRKTAQELVQLVELSRNLPKGNQGDHWCHQFIQLLYLVRRNTWSSYKSQFCCNLMILLHAGLHWGTILLEHLGVGTLWIWWIYIDI